MNSIHTFQNTTEAPVCTKGNYDRRLQIKDLDQKRRRRLQELMKNLETIVFPDQLNDKKVTQEAILQQAISMLSIKCEEKQSTPSKACMSAASQSFLLQSGLSGFMPIIDDYFFKPSKEEAEFSFNVIKNKIGVTKKSITTYNEKEKFEMLLEELEQIAIITEKPELQLYSVLYQEIYHSLFDFDTIQEEKVHKRAMKVYESMSIKPTTLIADVEAGTFLRQREAHILASKGQFSQALKVWQDTHNDVMQVSASVAAKGFFYSAVGCFYYQIGESVPFLPEFELIKHPSLICLPLLYSSHGLSLIDNARNIGDMRIGLIKIKTGYDILAQRASPHLAEGGVGPLLVYAYSKMGQFDEAIKLGSKLIQRVNIGGIGRSEVERLLAEILIKQNGQFDSQPQVEQILHLLKDSLRCSVGSSHLKSAITYGSFIGQVHDNPNFMGDISDGILTLEKALEKVERNPKFTIIREAYKVLEQLKGISKECTFLCSSNDTSSSSPSSSSTYDNSSFSTLSITPSPTQISFEQIEDENAPITLDDDLATFLANNLTPTSTLL